LDLKLANLLVSGDAQTMNFEVKVADFGLTQMKTESAVGMVGSPFYMAPEMLLEKDDYDEKVDVYSFGILLWELYTQAEPYKDQFSDLEELIEAVTIDIERPTMPKEVPPRLKDLITSCWHNEADKRPSFASIVENCTIPRIIIELEITSKDAQKFWLEEFLGSYVIPWDKFYTAFSTKYNLVYGDNDPKIRVLKALLCGLDSTNTNITMKAWNEVVEFFGPLKSGDSFLDTMDSIVQKAWFFGPLSTGEAEKMLKSAKKKGTFLIRFSTSTAGSYTLSFVKGKTVQHGRIGRTPDGQYVFSNKNYKSLEDFLNKNQKSLGLSAYCPNSPYQTLYSSNDANFGAAQYMYGST